LLLLIKQPVSNEALPLTLVIPTRDRAPALRLTLESLAEQSFQPAEVRIVDASSDGGTRALCEESIPKLRSAVSWCRAEVAGAASQRNQGIRTASQATIGFMDDDVLLEPDCFERLWRALNSDDRIGGVSAMITNQRYQAPGRTSRFVFRLMDGHAESSYAGRVLGPAVNLLPEDRDDLPEVVPVEWLNTTCTLYRREALPNPPFPEHFQGYSLMEDVTLSLTVGRRWKLANARTARIYHDSQPGSHKGSPRLVAEMQLINRHYVMTEVLGRSGISDYLKLFLFELFLLASTLQVPSGRALFVSTLRGKARASWSIVTRRQ
jgi:glycosyltransferase involved in cell wall biosynthesis